MITNTLNARNAVAAVVTGLVDQGTTFPTGRLVIFDVNNVVLSTQLLANPSFQAPVGGVAQANTIAPDPTPLVGGVPSRFECQDRNGAWVFRGTVGPTGDLGTPAGAIPPGTPASTSQFAYQAPP